MVLMTYMLVACTPDQHGNALQENDEQLNVYVSFYSLYDFTKKIGGDLIAVHNMLPPGVEPHDFEPTPKDMVQLHEADLFVYNGAGFETWAEKAIDTLNKEKTRVVNATESLSLVADDHAHGHGQLDPHVWLDPNLAKQQADAIKQALIQLDPDHATIYQQNFNQLSAKFDELDTQLQEVAHSAERHEIFVSHAAFGYLTDRYGWKQIAISGLSPSSVVTQRELQNIIELAKAHEVKFIMFETLASSKVADVVKREIGAEALSLHPIENLTKEQMAQGEDYFSLMRHNIENLRQALNAERK